MSNFSDLLKQPLPSKGFSYFESDLDDECYNNDSSDFDTDDDIGGYGDTGYPSTDDPFDDDDDDTVDTDFGTGYNDPNPFAAQSSSTPAPAFAQNEDAEEDNELDPEESQNVDDTMNTVATPILMDGELKDEEIDEFVESVEADIAVNEGFLTEKTIIKFDKNAKKAQLFEVAVAAVASEKKDPLYKKLKTVYKMERTIKAKLRKKYHTAANQKVKEYLARARRSKSGLLARIASKLSKNK